MSARPSLGLPVLIVSILALAACATPPAQTASQFSTDQAPAITKRIVTALVGNLYTLSGFISAGAGAASQPGHVETSQLFNVGLSISNGGVQEPRLAQAMPTTDNGLWVVLPDGRMTTTWKLKPNGRLARWNAPR